MAAIYLFIMNYSNFKSYIEGLGSSNTDINTTIFASPFDGLQRLMQGKTAPVLLVESPDVELDGDDIISRKALYNSKIVILQILSNDATQTEKKTVRNATLAIILEFVAKIEEDYQDGTIGALEWRSDIRQVQYNSWSGWSLGVSIGDNQNIGKTDAKWL